MELLLFAVLLAGQLASAEPAAGVETTRARETDQRRRIVLTWIDPEKAVPNTSAISASLTSLFSEIGVQIAWRDYSGRSAPSTSELELHLHLRNQEPKRWDLARDAMGVVFHGKESVRRIYVFLPAIARTIGYEPSALSHRLKKETPPDLARALSRVIAHEVVHAIVPNLPHAERGITRGTLSRKALISDRAEFETIVVLSVLKKLDGSAASAPAAYDSPTGLPFAPVPPSRCSAACAALSPHRQSTRGCTTRK